MKKGLSVILCLVMMLSVFTAVPFGASSAENDGVVSGTTGDCTWTLNGTELTISGDGAMEDYNIYSDTFTLPWGYEITKVIISDGVNHIGNYAFFSCTELTSVTIPDSVTSIGGSAFFYCSGLTSVTIPDSVTSSIGDFAFECCLDLTSVTIGNSVTSIGEYAFARCPKLTGVTIPDSVTSIGVKAFYNCEGLTSVTIPETVTSIGDFAFGYYNYNNKPTKTTGFTIYGYTGTAAETYADDNGFTFIALSDKADSDTGIAASVTADITLNVKDITGTDAVGNIQLNGGTILKAYDVTLIKNGEAVQPDHVVTVKIPCADKKAKVYRVEADGSLTDMHAVYTDGYLVFTTDHFSIYIVATDAEKPELLLGDVDGDGTVTIIDATFIQRKLASIPIPFEFNDTIADTDEDSSITIIDATYIQRWLENLQSNDKIGKPLNE